MIIFIFVPKKYST